MSQGIVNEFAALPVHAAHERARRSLELVTDLDRVLPELLAVEAQWAGQPVPAPGLVVENRVLIGAVLARLGRFEESKGWLEQAIAALPEDDAALRRSALNAYAITLRRLGDTATAFRLLDELEEQARREGTPRERARVLTNKANILRESGDFAAALALRLEAIQHARQVRDPGLRSRMLINAGFDQISLNDVVAAERSLREANLELIGTEDVFTRANALLLEGSVELQRECHREALLAFEHGLILLGAQAGGVIRARLQLHAAQAHNRLGEFSQAAPLLEAAERVLREAGHRDLWLECLLAQARSRVGRRDWADAEALAEQVDREARDGLLTVCVEAVRLRADIAECRGNLAAALAHFRTAEQLRAQCEADQRGRQLDLIRVRQAIGAATGRHAPAQGREEIPSDHYEALREKNRELERLHHEKRELLTIIAHDLRNQLGATVNMTELALLPGEASAADLREHLQSIYAITRSTQELLEHLLGLERIEGGEVPVLPEPIALGQWARVHLERLANLGQMKGMRLTVEELGESVVLETDETWLRLALENLLTNAFKYAPVGSRVTLRFHRSGSRVRIEVLDEGPGILEEDRANLFTKFHRTRNQPTGGEFSTGLGLYLVRQYAELLGCEIGFEPREPVGSIFYLEFVEGAED